MTAVAGGAAVLAGVTLWQLGIEFERAWIRSYDSPMLGETGDGELASPQQRAQIAGAVRAEGERRRWVANPHIGAAARTRL